MIFLSTNCKSMNHHRGKKNYCNRRRMREDYYWKIMKCNRNDIILLFYYITQKSNKKNYD